MAAPASPPAGASPSPPAAFLGCLVAQEALHLFLPVGRVVPAPWNALGIPMALAGILLHRSAWRLFRRRGAPLDTLAEPASLVTEGAFRVSRNPMYLAGVLILAGAATLYGTLTPWIVPPAFAALAAARFIRREERLLAARFGDDYRTYGARVGRWVGPL